MPATITLTSAMRVVGTTGLSIEKRQKKQTITVAGDDHSSNTQVIPTTAGGTLVVIAAAVGTPGVARFHNLDATNYVDLGRQVAGTFYEVIRLLAGEFYDFRLACANNALYALANGGSVRLDHEIIEN